WRLALFLFFFCHVPPTTLIYTLSLHDALPIYRRGAVGEHLDALDRGHGNLVDVDEVLAADRVDAAGGHAPAVDEHQRVEVAKLRSEEHTSELQSRFDLVCRLLLEKKKINTIKK